MSLLIKALQKAEQEKKADDKAGASDSGLSLELAPIQSTAEQDLDKKAGFSQPSPNQNQKNIGQQAAATVFSAKASQPTRREGNGVLLLSGLGLITLLFIGGGFYYYINSLNKPVLAMPKPMTATSQLSTPATTAKNDSLVTPPAEMHQAAPPVTSTEAPKKPESAVKDLSAKAAESVPVNESREPRASGQKLAARSQQLVFGESIAPNEDTAVQVTRNNPAPGINPNILSAYAAFNAGDDATAQRYYRQALQSDVHSVDALLGMAAIAARQGRNSDAAGWYDKVLEVEPRNSIAQAAMVSLQGKTDPVSSESHIKNLLVQQPEASYLHASLGNLYAEQGQWASAQLAYFQAHHFDPNNAEYAFNLAVSLDQLGKKALALQYYKTTLELLPKSGLDTINRTQVESRITQLQ